MNRFRVPLRLVFEAQAEPNLPVMGWYLPNAEPSEWIAACVRGRVRADQFRFFLAESDNDSFSGDSHPGYHLIALSLNTSITSVPDGAIGFAKEAWNPSACELWRPCTSRIMPSIPSSMLKRVFEDEPDGIYVWLPQNRLLVFSTEDEVDLSRLLSMPRSESGVDRMSIRKLPQVPPLAEKITSIVLPPSLSQEQFFQEAAESIGDSADELQDLDDSGRTGQGGVSGFANRIFRKVLENLSKRLSQGKPAKKAPAAGKQSSRQPTRKGIGSRVLSKVNSKLNEMREKQIEKLLKLMSQDPDLALRYALPLANASAPRGLSQPGAKLSKQTPDFSLNQLLGGGRPADPWQLEYETQRRLREAYQKQAEREMAAGRYRRAAYIFAHLLGDLSSAAATLEKGHFYQEAAELYSTRLSRPRDAARCLVAAGQFEGAARVYEDLKDYVAAGEMWSAIDEKERARESFEKGIQHCIQNRDILKAAKLIEDRLSQPTRAEHLLWSQWPSGVQVRECVEQVFQRYAADGRHAEARQRFEELVEKSYSSKNTLLAKIALGLAKSFPDPLLRKRAEDRCRIAVASNLVSASPEDRDSRMEILRDLHPQDTLLRRDTRRYAATTKTHEFQLATVDYDRTKSSILQPRPAFRLTDGRYTSAVMIGSELLAVALTKSSIRCSRLSNFFDNVPSMNWINIPVNRDMDPSTQCQSIVRPNSNEIQLHLDDSDLCYPAVELATPTLQGANWLIIASPVVAEKLGGYTSHDSRWTIRGGGRAMQELTSNGIRTFDLLDPAMRASWESINVRLEILDDGASVDFDSDQVHFASVNGRPFVSVDRVIMTTQGDQLKCVATFERPIHAMCASALNTKSRLIVCEGDRLHLVHCDEHYRCETLNRDTVYRSATFHPRGYVVAATNTELHVFGSKKGTLVLIARDQLVLSKLVAVLPLAADLVGVLYQDGLLENWRLI